MRFLKLLLALAVLPSPVLAAPRPLGREIAVNVASQGSHGWGLPAMFSDGSFVVVWRDKGQKDAVHARFFRRDGSPAGGEFRLLPASANSSAPTSIVVDRDDSFLVAWDDTPPRQSSRVLVQRFSHAGKALGSALQVHAGSPRARYGGRLALRPGGGFAVAWMGEEDYLTQTDEGEEIYAGDVYVRAYTAAGVPLGPELRANETTGDDQSLTGFAVLQDGRLLVLYSSWEGIYTLHMRRLPPGGPPLEPETWVSSEYPNGPSGLAALGMAPDGTFTIAWSSFALGDGVAARRFAADGSPLTADFLVTPMNDAGFDVAALPDGGFVAVWTPADSTRNRVELFARAFGPDGFWLEVQLQVDQGTAAFNMGPAIAGRDGRFVATWSQTDDLSRLPLAVRARVLAGNWTRHQGLPALVP